jgi:hypothetical protein
MSNEINSSFGGLKIRNLNEININLFCELCKLLQLHPMQLLCCGTRLCRWCSKKGVPDSEPFVCPFCQTKQLKKQAQTDRAVERELNMIKIECYACSWIGSYKNYLEHLQQNHADRECSDCHARFFATNPYEEHRQEICEHRHIPCGLPGCKELIKWSDMGTHYLTTKHQRFLIEFIAQKRHSPNKTASNIVSNKTQEIKAIEESVDILSPVLTTVLDDCTRLRSEHDQIKSRCETNISQINETKKIFNADNEKFLSCVQSQNEMDKQLEDVNKLYASTHILSLDEDGSMTFSFRRSSEEINSSFSMYSPTFRTAPYGYLFILRVCSTMKDNQPYLSIYITLLRSDFDPILFYPFSYNISLCLCDQSGQGKHIISTIKPDSNSSAFARPISERNDEIGINEFCPLNYLTDIQSIYLKDGVFFIRISIDFMKN